MRPGATPASASARSTPRANTNTRRAARMPSQSKAGMRSGSVS